MKHIRPIGKSKQPQLAASLLKALKGNKKPPFNGTMTL